MSIKKNYDKNGNLISARITVYCGHDGAGKEVRRKKTIKIPANIKPSKVDAFLNREAVLFEQVCKEENVLNGDIPFSEYIDRAMKTKRRQGLKTSTLDRYDDLIDRIKPKLGGYKLNKITPPILNDFYEYLAEEGKNTRTKKGLSPKTIKEHHNLIASILDMACDDELIPRNPARKAKPPKVTRPEIESFDIETIKEIRKCLDNEPLKWKLLTCTLIVTGARRGEILGLKWTDLEKDILHINRAILYSRNKGIYEDSVKTKSSKRYYKLPASIVEMLQKHKIQQNMEKEKYGDAYTPSPYIFTKVLGGPMHPDSITDYLRKFSERYGLPHINPHKFRHTVASILIAEGEDPVTVSHYLGHSNPTVTTSIYAHAFSEKQIKAAEVLGEKLLE